MPAGNLSFIVPESRTLSRLPQPNLPALVAIIMAAWLTVAVCYADSSIGKTKKATSASAPVVRGAYFGQKLPGKTPELFAPGILSQPNRMEARIAFSPDGNECFFTVPNDFNFTNVQMYYTKRVNNEWTPQVLAPFSLPGHSYSQPFFSADGNKLYFTSAESGSKKIGIWVVERTSHGWGTPQLLPPPINSDDETGEYSQTKDGTAYFESDRSGGMGMVDLWRATPQHPGQPLEVENLGASINTATYDSDPFISPDGKYLIFSSNRAGAQGGADLYVTFLGGKGTWSAPVNLNQYIPGINTDAVEYGASLSPDGLYLFFVRLDPNARRGDVYWVENPFSRQIMHQIPMPK